MLGHLQTVAANEITTTKMENNNVSASKVEEPVQITTKDPKKVEAGKRLAEFNHRKREELAQVAKAWDSKPKLTLSQAYGVGDVIAVGMLDLLG